MNTRQVWTISFYFIIFTCVYVLLFYKSVFLLSPSIFSCAKWSVLFKLTDDWEVDCSVVFLLFFCMDFSHTKQLWVSSLCFRFCLLLWKLHFESEAYTTTHNIKTRGLTMAGKQQICKLIRQEFVEEDSAETGYIKYSCLASLEKERNYLWSQK